MEVDGLWKLAGIISSCIHNPVVKENGKNVSICDFNNYLVYTDVSNLTAGLNELSLIATIEHSTTKSKLVRANHCSEILLK